MANYFGGIPRFGLAILGVIMQLIYILIVGWFQNFKAQLVDDGGHKTAFPDRDSIGH